MKKIIIYILTVVFVLGASSLATFAQGQTIDAVSSASATTTKPTPKPTPSPVAASAAVPDTTIPATEKVIVDTQVGITPDNILYPLKKMVESVQVTLTFSPEGKAELLVSFANERLAEAEIMTERNKQELVLKIMDTYVKTINEANEKTEEAALNKTDVKSVLENIQITEQTAEKIVIKATGMIPNTAAEQFKTAVSDQVKKTISVQALAVAKSSLSEAKDQVRQAQKKLKMAKKSGSEILQKTAAEELQMAEQSRVQAQDVKDQVAVFKKGVVDEIKVQDRDEDSDKDDKTIEKAEKLKEKIAKMEQIAKKHQDKRQEIIEKNTEKQLDDDNEDEDDD